MLKNAVIDLSEVSDELADCQPGDQYQVTFTVSENDGKRLMGSATEIEPMEDEEDPEGEADSPEEDDGEDYPSEDRMPKGEMARKHMGKVPKAIMIVASK